MTPAVQPPQPAAQRPCLEALPKFRDSKLFRGATADIQSAMALEKTKSKLPAGTADPFWRALEGALGNCSRPGNAGGSSATNAPPSKELQAAMDRVFRKDAIPSVLPAVPARVVSGASQLSECCPLLPRHIHFFSLPSVAQMTGLP